MTVRQKSLAVAALLALFLGAGCGERDATPVAAEADEPHFRQGQQLARQGREPEALTSFLKVIEKRGAQNAPESHLEAGLIYLKHIKDPIEAIHHFRKYRELKPNSQQAVLVRQQVDAAIREFAARLPARPGEDQSVRLEVADELERLRRENAELRAELATLRGGGATPIARTPRMFTLPESPRPRAPSAEDSPITLATPRAAAAPIIPVSPAASAAMAPNRLAVQPSGAAPPDRGATAPKAAANSGRTHVVAERESLWSIARKYYGSATTGAKVQALRDANRGVITDPNSLKTGTTLKIP